jgi:hypothetical protein
LPTDKSTNWVPGWRPFHTNLLVFSSQADFQLTWQLNCLTNQLLHVTSLNWTADNFRLQLGWCPHYSLGVDTTENTASNNPPIVVMDSCLAIDWISFPRERVYRPLLRNGCLFFRLLHSNGRIRCLFCGVCPAMVLYATICIDSDALLSKQILGTKELGLAVIF